LVGNGGKLRAFRISERDASWEQVDYAIAGDEE
jgi:hypothetical protein